MTDIIASWPVTGILIIISSATGSLFHIEFPKSPIGIPFIQFQYCNGRGSLVPSSSRSFSKEAGSTAAAPSSPANNAYAISPGTIRIRRNTKSVAPMSVGIINNNLLNIKVCISFPQ